MLHQGDIKIINNHLAREKHRGLQAFTERRGYFAVDHLSQLGSGKDAGENDGCHIGCNRTLDSRTQFNKQPGSSESDHALQKEVSGQSVESARPLDESSTHTQRNVKSCSESQKDDQNWIR